MAADVADAVTVPVTFIMLAEVEDIAETAPAVTFPIILFVAPEIESAFAPFPNILPVILTLGALVAIATVVVPPVIFPLTVKVVPENNTEPDVNWLPPFTLLFIVSVPAV